MVGALLQELRACKPVLYKQVEPTELQLTCFLKSNAKRIKDALMKLGNVKLSPLKIQDESNEDKSTAVEAAKPTSFSL